MKSDFVRSLETTYILRLSPATTRNSMIDRKMNMEDKDFCYWCNMEGDIWDSDLPSSKGNS